MKICAVPVARTPGRVKELTDGPADWVSRGDSCWAGADKLVFFQSRPKPPRLAVWARTPSGKTETSLGTIGEYPTVSPDQDSVAFLRRSEASVCIGRLTASVSDVVTTKIMFGIVLDMAWFASSRELVCAVRGTKSDCLYIVGRRGFRKTIMVPFRVVPPICTVANRYLAMCVEGPLSEALVLDCETGMVVWRSLSGRECCSVAWDATSKRLWIAGKGQRPEVWSVRPFRDLAAGL